MSTASDKPPTGRRGTATPYAVLRPSQAPRAGHQTATRVKVPETPVFRTSDPAGPLTTDSQQTPAQSESSESSPPSGEASRSERSGGAVGPSVPPESLKRPFASLTPKRPIATGSSPAARGSSTAGQGSASGQPPRGAGPPRGPLQSLPPTPPSQLFKQTASQRPADAPSLAPKPDAARRTCKKHKVAKTPQGECVLCRREEQLQKSERGWRLIVGLAVLALVVGLVVAYLFGATIPGDPFANWSWSGVRERLPF